MRFCRPWRKHVQSLKKTGIKLYEELQSQGTHCLYIWGQKMTKFTKLKKVTKTNVRIISKAHAHLQTIEKTCAKFKKIGTKNCIRSCAHEVPTVYILWVKKRLSSHDGKSDKKDLTIISKPHAHPLTMKKTHAKLENDRYKTVRGIALTRGTHYL